MKMEIDACKINRMKSLIIEINQEIKTYTRAHTI